MTKKIDKKAVFKEALMAEFVDFVREKYAFEKGEDFGFTKHTLVVHAEEFDAQVKFITAKTGKERYEKVTEE